MTYIENVIKGLDCHRIDDNHRINCADCPYYIDDHIRCVNDLHDDAVALLKDQEAAYQGAEELLRQKTILFGDAIKRLEEQKEKMKHLNNITLEYEKEVFRLQTLLKEKKAKTGHWIWLQYCANEGVYCSECHTKMFDRYPMKKKLSQFCGHCGAKMDDEAESR